MIKKFRGVLTVADTLRELHVRRRSFKGGQGFAAFGRKFEGPPPLWMFLTPSLNSQKILIIHLFTNPPKAKEKI